MNNFQRVLHNTFFLTLSEAFLKVLGLLWIIYLGNMLSVALFGRYSFVNSFITIFSFLPEIGIGLVVVREIARNTDKAHEYISSTIAINFLMGVVTVITLLILGFIFQYPYDTMILLILASGTLFFASLRAAPLYYFEGIQNMKMTALLSSFNTFFLIGGGIVGFSLLQSLYGIFLGMLIGTIVSVLVCYGIFFQRYTLKKFDINTKLIKTLIISGLPLAIASFSYLVYTRVESVILQRMLGDQAVGIYNSATPFVFSLMQLLNLPFLVAVYPTLSKLFIEDKTRFQRAVGKSLLVIALWSFPASLVIYYVSPIIIPFLFGSKFSAGIPILQHLIFFVPFASLSTLLYKILIIYNKQKIYMWLNLFGALLDIFLNIFFIKQYGIIGAAYGSVATQIILFILYGIIVFTIIKNDHLKTV